MAPRHKQSGKNRNTGIVYKYDPFPLFRLLLLHLLEFPVDISDDSDAGLERLRKLSNMDHVSWPLEVFTSTEPSLALALLNRLDKVDPTSSFIRVPGSRRTVLQQKGELDGRHADVEVLRAMLQSRLWAADDPRFQRTRDIIEKRKQQAVTAREPLKRAFWAQSALNLCVASGDLDLLEEALIWARRFAKDSQTSRGLFVGHGTGVLTDELDRLLSCVPREDDHPSRLSSDYVVKGIAAANRIAIELAQVVAAAASEPAFNIYHWANVLLVTRTMVKLRVDGAAAFAKVIDDEPLRNETIWKPTITNFFDLDDRHPTSASAHRELLPSGPRIATLIGQLLHHMTPNHLAELASFSLQTMKTRLSAESLRAMTDATVSITMCLTRSDQPALACPFICQAITNDGGENSSWHRQLFTVEFLSSLPAAAAKEFLHSIASGITDIMREQNARPWRPDMKPDPSARHVKVTTIKMVAQTLRGNVYLDALSTTNILISLLDEARHIDARITLVSSLIGILEEPTTTPSLRQRVLVALEASVVPVLARVNERFPVADDEWEKVPEVGDESPLLSTLIERAGSVKLGTEDKAFLTGIITQGLVQSVENNKLWMQAFLAKNNFVVDSLPSSPVHPAILESVLAKFYEFVPVSLLDTMKSIALANLNPPADVAQVTKLVKADTELAASNAGLHWLRVFDDSPRRVLDLGLSEAVAVFLHTDEPACHHISDLDLRSFIVEAAESMVRLGEVDILDSLVFALSCKRTQGGKHLDVWNNKGVPIIEDIVDVAQELQDASDRPSVLPNTFRLQTKVLPIPFSDTQKPSSAEALDTLARGLSVHIEQLARHRVPYHIDFQHLREDMSYIQTQDLAYVAVALAAIEDAVSARDPTLETYLRLELVADFLEKASDPGEEVAGQVRELVGIWKTCKAEGLRVMGQQVEKTLTNKGIGSKHWFTASLK
ncbi:hypothetical protein B0T11DRAFT_93985 [Plectosphaerella cucumerina]|uniref:Uncharacterized protein n=1 Tax=Plectosphaerella cucumerina TaxID=40658 RepID=A0A8K0X478_9PEZI|nr:hypothetical protein B0T11DRAFT_93985 [Plectosphaerella cucumerina]